jgi:hypothetical protein
MTQFLIIREVADGAARLIGITEDTTLTPKQVADQWLSTRAEITEKVRLYFADVADVTIVDADPQLIRRVTTTKVDPATVFTTAQIIDLPDQPAPAP